MKLLSKTGAGIPEKCCSVKLTKQEIKRYARQLVLPEIGMAGQERLKSAKVLVVGAGGLGSPVLLYLAAAGVGTIGVVDSDAVDFSNLQRQVLHFTTDVGRPKLLSVGEKVRALNPGVKLVPYETRLTKDNALGIIKGYDLVVDGSDNFPTRYLVNDACFMLGKPDVHGSILQFHGQCSVFAPRLGGPCYRCLFPEPPPAALAPSCAEAGVLGAVCGVIGSIQALETVKLIIGGGEPLVGRLLLFDALAMRVRELAVPRDPHCPLCGATPTITELVEYDAFCGVGQRAETAVSQTAGEISARELKQWLERGRKLTIVDVRTPAEWAICHIEGARLLPLAELPSRWTELNKRELIVLCCHHGRRSMRALRFLRERGFTKLKNLKGGLDAWARSVDRKMPRY